MTDHLPECYWPDTPERAICICDRLRACEQRVREDMALQYLVSDREQQESEDRAYAAGLDAAREAIRNREDGEYFPWVQVEIALAAIDALRGGQ